MIIKLNTINKQLLYLLLVYMYMYMDKCYQYHAAYEHMVDELILQTFKVSVLMACGRRFDFTITHISRRPQLENARLVLKWH